jgi:iron-sulfur cluster insertion protein
MIEITESALGKLQTILNEEHPGGKLRIFIQGGGCSGFQYGFAIEQEQEEDDFVITEGGVSVLVDSMSSAYLQGATVDYSEDQYGENFTIKNPNASSHCGCGSSFTPY